MEEVEVLDFDNKPKKKKRKLKEDKIISNFNNFINNYTRRIWYI